MGSSIFSLVGSAQASNRQWLGQLQEEAVGPSLPPLVRDRKARAFSPKLKFHSLQGILVCELVRKGFSKVESPSVFLLTQQLSLDQRPLPPRLPL